jgi:GDP-mannose 6-dehydrogenase
MVNISIFGLGYVGCVGLACLARSGHKVTGVDPQATKVEFINSGKPTIVEPGIDELMAEAHQAGRISATVDGFNAALSSDVAFVCVGTPPTTKGHLELGAILTVCEQIGRALREKQGRLVIAIRSTVLPGTNERVSGLIEEVSGKKAGVDFAVVSNPEFLREASAIEDFLSPSYTLLGSNCAWATDLMKEVYATLDAPVVVAEPKVAELMKYVCNSFHALKITFANEVGGICKSLGIDSHELMNIFCLDTKLNISKAYLKPGFAYGGSCLPKDLRALQTIAHDNYISCPVLESVERSNQQMKDRVCREIQELGKQQIGFLGLSFKAGTDDLRESPILDVIERLLGKGYDVRIYDKHVHLARLTGANKEYILQRIPFISRFITDDLQSVIQNSEVVVVVNKEPGLKEALAGLNSGKQVYDLANVGLGRTRPLYSGIAW